MRDAVPALTEFRAWGESLRERVLKEAGGDAEKATHLLLRRLMHDPTEALKAAAKRDTAELTGLEAALRRLFTIENDDGNEEDLT